METRSLYVHIPFCESICSYCDFCKVYYDQKQSDLYLQRLNEELKVKEPKDESEDVDTDKLSQDLLSSLNLGDDNN